MRVWPKHANGWVMVTLVGGRNIAGQGQIAKVGNLELLRIYYKQQLWVFDRGLVKSIDATSEKVVNAFHEGRKHGQ